MMSRLLLAVCCVIGLNAVRGAEPASPAVVETDWGQITTQQKLGVQQLSVAVVPPDRRLSIPQPIPYVVCCELTAEPFVTLPFEFDAEAKTLHVVLPNQDQPVKSVRLQTAESSQQFPDGRIALSALDALVVGQKAKLESHPGNHRIGYWSDPADHVVWNFATTRPGMYRILLTYSCAGPSGNEVQIEIASEQEDPHVLTDQLASTGSWYRYTTRDLGPVYLATGGSKTWTVRCTKLVGGAVMNLKSILLIPACEGTSPIQADDGTLTLHARDAIVHGVTMRWEPLEHKQTLGYWVNVNDFATWKFHLNAPGTFDVEVWQGCGTGQGGSDMQVGTTSQPINWQVEETGHFQNFKPRIIGTLTFDASGEFEVFARPVKIARNAACDIRQIRLVPHGQSTAVKK